MRVPEVPKAAREETEAELAARAVRVAVRAAGAALADEVGRVGGAEVEVEAGVAK